VLVQDALADHRLRPAEPLLAGLEAEDDVPREALALLDEDRRGAQQHRHVAVVSAGVHLAGNGGPVGPPGRFFDRQRVHVRAEQHRRRRRPARPENGDDTGLRDARSHVEIEGPQPVGHETGGLPLFEPQLRGAVKRTAPRDQRIRDPADSVLERVGHRCPSWRAHSIIRNRPWIWRHRRRP
jgi:hypothetical protein